MAQTATKIIKVVIVGQDQLTPTTKRISGGMSAMSSAASMATGALAALGVQFSVAGLVGAMRKGTEAAAEFSLAIGRIGTLIPGQVQQLARLTEHAKGLSAQYGLLRDDIAEATFQAISAGVNAGSATGFMDVAAKSATASYATLSETVRGLTTVINAYGLDVSEAGAISDAMFAANKFGVTTARELSQHLGTVAAMAATAGVSYRELFSATAAMTKAGVSTAEAMVGMRAILASIVKPSNKAKKITEELGVQWDIGLVKARGFTGVIEEMQKTLDLGGQPALAAMIKRVEGFSKAMALLSGTGLQTFNTTLNETESRLGQTDEALKEVTQTAGKQFKQSLNDISNLFADAGESTMPAATNAMRAAAAALETIGGAASAVASPVDTFTKAIKGNEEAMTKSVDVFNTWLAMPLPMMAGLLLLIRRMAGAKDGMTDLEEAQSLVQASLDRSRDAANKYSDSLSEIISEVNNFREGIDGVYGPLEKVTVSFGKFTASTAGFLGASIPNSLLKKTTDFLAEQEKVAEEAAKKAKKRSSSSAKRHMDQMSRLAEKKNQIRDVGIETSKWIDFEEQAIRQLKETEKGYFQAFAFGVSDAKIKIEELITKNKELKSLLSEEFIGPPTSLQVRNSLREQLFVGFLSAQPESPAELAIKNINSEMKESVFQGKELKTTIGDLHDTSSLVQREIAQFAVGLSRAGDKSKFLTQSLSRIAGAMGTAAGGPLLGAFATIFTETAVPMITSGLGDLYGHLYDSVFGGSRKRKDFAPEPVIRIDRTGEFLQDVVVINNFIGGSLVRENEVGRYVEEARQSAGASGMIPRFNRRPQVPR